MKKITLIDLGTTRREFNEPLGIEVLAGCLRRTFGDAIVVKLVSLQLDELDRCLFDIFDCDLLGISGQVGSSEKVLQILKAPEGNPELTSKPVIVIGSILPTYASKCLLEIRSDMICVRGEGEDAIVGIVGSLLQYDSKQHNEFKKILLRSDVPNLTLSIDGEICSTSRRLVDLASVAQPARDFLPEIISRKGIVRIEGSRGCPWSKCTFCSISSKYGTAGWRAFPVTYVLDEIEELADRGVTRPYFTDEDFIGSDSARALDLANRIIEGKQAGRISEDLKFYASTSVNTILKCGSASQIRDLFWVLGKAGLEEVSLGIESGCPTQLKRYGKGVSVEQNTRVLSLLRKMGFEVDLGFILFDPEMSLSELQCNLRFIREARLDTVDARLTKPMLVLPGTVLAERLLSQGWVEEHFDMRQLYHSYVFRDHSVQRVFETFKEWEDETAGQVYAIQGRMRGEVTTETQREEDRKTLRHLRKLDLQFLESCIAVVRSNNRIGKDSLRKVIEDMDDLSSKRERVIRMALPEKHN